MIVDRTTRCYLGYKVVEERTQQVIQDLVDEACQYLHVNVPGIITHTAPVIFGNTAPLSRRFEM